MDKIIIEGGRRLAGQVRVSGSKNAALPILFSALLADGVNRYDNVPNLRDIDSTLLLLSRLGARVESGGPSVRIDASGLNCHEAPYDLVRKMRASVLVLGPLVARLKRARVSLPGGCAIGARPGNLHVAGLEAMGAKIALRAPTTTATRPRAISRHCACRSAGVRWLWSTATRPKRARYSEAGRYPFSRSQSPVSQ